MQCADELVRIDVLQQVTLCAVSQRIDQVALVAAGGQHDHGHVQIRLADLLQELEPGHPGHAHVEQHDIGLQLAGLLEAFGSAPDGGDHIDSAVLEQTDQPDTKQRMVVDEEDSQAHWAARRAASNDAGSSWHVRVKDKRVPSSGSLSMRRRAPIRCARSSMMESPM